MAMLRGVVAWGAMYGLETVCSQPEVCANDEGRLDEGPKRKMRLLLLQAQLLAARQADFQHVCNPHLLGLFRAREMSFPQFNCNTKACARLHRFWAASFDKQMLLVISKYVLLIDQTLGGAKGGFC